MDKFFEMKLVETSLTAVKRIYDEKKYDALSGEEFMDMFKELQRKGKQNQNEEVGKVERYKIGLEKQLEELKQLRGKCFLSNLPKSSIYEPNNQNPYLLATKIIERKEENNAKRSMYQDYATKDETLNQVSKEEYFPRNEKPKTAEQYRDEGGAHLKAGRNLEAVECYKKALNIDPTHAVSYCNIGLALKRLKRV